MMDDATVQATSTLGASIVAFFSKAYSLFSNYMLAYFWKVIIAFAGLLLALVLAGDIDASGNIKITKRLLAIGIAVVAGSITGGSFIIEMNNLQLLSDEAKGFIYFCFAVFEFLVFGILYRAFELLNGKALSEIAREVSSAVWAIMGRNHD